MGLSREEDRTALRSETRDCGMESIVIAVVEGGDLVDARVNGIFILNEIAHQFLCSAQGSQSVDILHEIRHVHKNVVSDQFGTLARQRKVLFEPLRLRVETKCGHVIPVLKAGNKPDGVRAETDITTEISCERAGTKINIQIRVALAQKFVVFAEIAVSSDNALRVLVFVLHVFPLESLGQIIVPSLADLLEIAVCDRGAVG